MSENQLLFSLMKPFTAALVSTGVAIAAVLIALSSFSTRAFGNSSQKAAEEARLERGRYLVHRVGLCIDCHSPRNEKGEFIEEKHLTGSPLAFAATVPMPWVAVAPKIAGLPAGFTSDDMVHFLMTGQRPNGRPAPLPPMPPYRMERADAEAVTAYLKSMDAGK